MNRLWSSTYSLYEWIVRFGIGGALALLAYGLFALTCGKRHRG